MTAGHGGAQDPDGTGDAGEYGGMDALMAAITGEPLPEEARRDPAFLAGHRAAEADVAVLREQLALIAEALTGERADGVPGERGAPGEHAGKPRTVPRPRGVTRPVRAGRRPPRPPRPGRPSGPRRALRVAFGTLAGATACALAVGFGWLVAHSGGSDDNAGAAAKGVGDAPAKISGDDGKPSDPARVLACSRLVVEGTVAEVEPQQQSRRSRITLTVIRSYEPAHGPARVSFLLGPGATPAPRPGQHVLVRIGSGRTVPGLWAVGDTRVAANRAWITEALPKSRHTTCSVEEAPTEKP
ncbi:hypothetical protein [Streptomyces sp. NPDC046759]|uniref:hypothetical protein n=1 Tax=Streptomyces sp. NPDC046759 TaxID=3155019 RepID=UPI00340DCCBB